MSVKVVNSGPDTIKVSVETTPAVKVNSPSVSALSIGYEKGDKGDTGATGATGATGPGVPTGGTQFQVLRKVSGTDYDTEWDYADRVTLEVRFDEAVSKGDPLYITGYSNGQNRITVAKADASDSSKMPSIGLAFADYSQNDNGQVITIGSLEDIDTQVTNDFQEGEVIYVASGGGLTNVKPTGTNLIQNVGKVGRRQQNNGEIVVMAIGRSNDVPNIPNGQAWIGNSSGVATPTTLATVATSGAATDLTGTLPVANGGTGATTFTDNALILGNGSGALETFSELTYHSATGTLRLTDSDAVQPVFDLKSTFASTLGGTLSFTKDRSDNTQNDGDILGLIQFNGEDDGGSFQNYATIHGAAEESGAGTEGGKLEIKVASHDGELAAGLIIEDGDAEDEVDVTIANGANSVTTVNGKLNVGGNYTMPTADGSSGQFLSTNGSGTLTFKDSPTNKFLQIFHLGFFDDLGTTKHYLPWKGVTEQTTIYQEEGAILMPFDGRVKSISIKTSSVTADGDITMGVHTIPTGSTIFATALWTEEETETLSATSTDDYHTFHFVFSNAQHFEAGDTVAISIQNSVDITGNGYWHCSAVVEFDTTNNLGTSSTEHDTNP